MGVWEKQKPAVCPGLAVSPPPVLQLVYLMVMRWHLVRIWKIRSATCPIAGSDGVGRNSRALAFHEVGDRPCGVGTRTDYNQPIRH